MPVEYLGPLEGEQNKAEYLGPLEKVEYVGPLKAKEPSGAGGSFKEPWEEKFVKDNPNLYGLYGAVTETPKELTKIGHLKYAYPEEREKYNALTTQQQTRQLLWDTLEDVGVLGAGRILKGASQIVQKYAPDTYKFWTKSRSLWGKKPAVNPTTEGASQVESMYDETSEAIKEIHKRTPKDIYKSLKRAIVDVSGNIKKELHKQGDLGRQAVIRHDLIAGANSKAIRQIDDATKQIFGDLTGQEQEYLNRAIQSRRTIAIEKYKDIKHPKGLGAKQHQEWLDSLAPEIQNKINTKTGAYFEVMKGQLDDLLNEGLITKKSHETLRQIEYSPRRFLQHIDPEKSYGFGGQKISIPDSGIKQLAGGSEELLEKDASLLMQQTISRTQTRIFRNKANKALYALAETQPTNGIVSKLKGRPPAGHETIDVMIEGQKKEMIMPSEMAREWVQRDPAINSQMANVIGWMSGAKVLRAMATGYNPEFALTNFPRDIAHIWLTTQEYSSTAPKAGAQLAKDLISVLPDAIFRKGRWTEYINEGGGMEFLTHQGKVTQHKGIWDSLHKVFGWLGETSEILPRLALRQRAINSGKSTEEATWIARNYLDFSQGGNFAKAMDSGVPYLNASIQGTRGIVRAASQNPGEFVYKVSQIGTLATGMYLANKNQNPEAWDQISDRDKINNWIITTPHSYLDKDGNKKHIYFKIAKDQGQRAVATLFENLMGKYMGEEIDVDQITDSIADAIPMLPTDLMPPTLDAIMGYTVNKDFWRNQDIWRGPEIEPKKEYTKYTHPAFVKAGEATGLSPERTKYALSQYFTHGNVYTSLAGYGWNQLLENLPEESKELVTEEVILNQPFVRRIANDTNPYYQYDKELKETKIKADTERYVRTRNFDKLSQGVYDKATTKEELNEFIKATPREDQKRLRQRHQRRGKLQEIPNRRWWLELSRLNPEAKATVFWNRLRDADEEETKMLNKYLRKVPGIRSDRFQRRLQQLKAKKIPSDQ